MAVCNYLAIAGQVRNDGSGLFKGIISLFGGILIPFYRVQDGRILPEKGAKLVEKGAKKAKKHQKMH